MSGENERGAKLEPLFVESPFKPPELPPAPNGPSGDREPAKLRPLASGLPLESEASIVIYPWLPAVPLMMSAPWMM
jgi:hypothetical protein